MIFDLTSSLADLESSDKERLHNVISDLLAVHRAGHHLVIMPRDLADWLVVNVAFNDRDKALLKWLRDDFTQSEQLLDAASIRVSVSPSQKSGIVVEQKRIVVGLNDVKWTYLLDRANLLIEDAEYDGQLYLKILDACKGQIDAPNVAFDRRNGGGTGIFHVWKHQVTEGHLVCLVADSDRRHPESLVPTKFSEARTFAVEKGFPFAWCHPLPCLEIENLIPLDVLRLLPCVFEKAADVDALALIAANEEASKIDVLKRFYLFYDLKLGLKPADLEANNPPGSSDWYAQKKRVGGDRAAYKGFGENILSQLLADGDLLNRFLKQVKRREWWDTFGDFVSLLLWIGFAPNVHRL